MPTQFWTCEICNIDLSAGNAGALETRKIQHRDDHQSIRAALTVDHRTWDWIRVGRERERQLIAEAERQALKGAK